VRITRTRALLLAAFTVWPFFYMILFMGFVVSSIFLMGGGRNNEPPFFMAALFAAHLFTMLDVFALLAIYIVHLFKTDAVAQDKKALWAVVLFMGNMIAMPVYWYLYMWKPLQLKEAAST